MEVLSGTNLLGCYESDGRVSLHHYADQLCIEFGKVGLNSKYIIPPEKKDFIKGVSNRARRYIGYPLYAKSLQKTELAHVVDEGYAHLAPWIKSNHKVVTLTDLMPLLGWKNLVNGLSYPRLPLFYYYSLMYLNKFDRVITFSETNKKQILELKLCKEEKVRVVPLGVDEVFFKNSIIPQDIARQRLGLNKLDFYVLISGREQYKNIETSLDAIFTFKKITKKNVKVLRLGGPNIYIDNLLKKYQRKLSVKSFTNLSREQVTLVYRSANVLLFPSWHEGFGMPVIEAMASGIPVINSNTASLPEITNKKTFIVSPNDTDGMVQYLEYISKYAEQISRMVENAQSYAKKYLWYQIAKSTLQVYSELSSRYS